MLSYVFLILAAIPAAQADSSLTQAPATTHPTAPIVLSGCVSRDAAPANSSASFSIADDTGTRYRLSGTDVQKYVGHRVEIAGKTVAIRGGLVPSANVAAQAGAMDPAKAAMATMPGGANSGTGNVALPEFRIARVRPLNGSCP